MQVQAEVIKNDGQRCPRMTGAYERELREVLSGTEKGVHAVTKSCQPEQRERMRQIMHQPFLVVRAAGSGMEGSGDLVALRGDCSFPIEVKTSKETKFYFSGRTKEQLEAMIREGERSGLMPLYAFRLKGVRGDSWRIFRVPTRHLKGTLRRWSTMIPSLPLNRNGNPFMDWDLGMPLNRFIGLMCPTDAPPADQFSGLLQRQASVHSHPARERVKEDAMDVLAELERRRTMSVLKHTE